MGVKRHGEYACLLLRWLFLFMLVVKLLKRRRGDRRREEGKVRPLKERREVNGGVARARVRVHIHICMEPCITYVSHHIFAKYTHVCAYI